MNSWSKYVGGSMRRPIKIAIILLILIGISALLPLLLGAVAQRYSSEFVQRENKTLGQIFDVQLQLIHYHRGWFRSTAILQIEQQTDAGNLELIKQIPVTIQHGPLYRAGNQFHIGFAAIKSHAFSPFDSLHYIVSLQNHVAFNGASHASLLITETPGADTLNQFHMDWLSLDVHANTQATHLHFNIKGQGLRFQDPQDSLSVNIQQLQSGLDAHYLGDRHWELQFGLTLTKNQVSTLMPGDATSMLTVNAQQLYLKRVHFDTEEMGKLLGEMAELKQAEDANQPIKTTAWMALFQQFLTQMIQSDTSVALQGLSVSTPMGQLMGDYNARFPTLPINHDYFDVATSNVGILQVDAPRWTYTDMPSHTEFSLTGLHYHENNHTVFLRNTNLAFDTFTVKNTQFSAMPVIDADGFVYRGTLQGDLKNLSQSMRWQLGKMCYTNICFDHIQGKIDALKMNYNAFRDIAAATQHVVQYDSADVNSMQTRWMNLANAYLKLITPQTELIFSHDMVTPEGNMEIQGDLSWPTINASITVAPTLDTVMDQAVYKLRLLFPAIYVDTFLAEEKTVATKNNQAEKAQPAAQTPQLESQIALFLKYAIAQGYFKKVGKAYTVDLTGRGRAITINGIGWKPY